MINTIKKTIYFLLVLIYLDGLSSQQISHINFQNSNVKLTNEKYFVDEEGNILINVNVWGHVKEPGNHLVYDGIDLPSLLSIVGGPISGANLKKIKIIRAENDNNELIYIINLENFYKTGDKSDFVEIMPHDTIIIEETMVSSVFRNSNTLTTILQILSIYIDIQQ